jgi:hypothetical protein
MPTNITPPIVASKCCVVDNAQRDLVALDAIARGLRAIRASCGSLGTAMSAFDPISGSVDHQHISSRAGDVIE